MTETRREKHSPDECPAGLGEEEITQRRPELDLIDPREVLAEIAQIYNERAGQMSPTISKLRSDEQLGDHYEKASKRQRTAEAESRQCELSDTALVAEGVLLGLNEGILINPAQVKLLRCAVEETTAFQQALCFDFASDMVMKRTPIMGFVYLRAVQIANWLNSCKP